MLGFYLQMIDTDDEKSKFEMAYQKYKGLLHYIAYSILKDPQLSEDAVQDAFFALARHMEKFRSQSCNQIRNYLIIIVRNAAFRIYNQNKREVLLNDMDPVADPLDLEADAEHTELLKELFRALKTLDSKYADVLILRYYYDFKEKEIARLLKITPENVKVRIHRGKKILKESLEKEEDDDRTSV